MARLLKPNMRRKSAHMHSIALWSGIELPNLLPSNPHASNEQLSKHGLCSCPMPSLQYDCG
eukprot:1157685-Pelagomonas_calceolata.AAC.2